LQKTVINKLVPLFIAFILMTGCVPGKIYVPTLTLTPTAAFTLSPTSTFTPSSTLAPIPTETPTATPIPTESGQSLEFSPLLPAVWHKEWTGTVSGMDIPIIIGLSDGVVHDKTPPITPIYGVWMTQEGADAVADAFLRAAHYRYTTILGNTVTYEQYLDLLKQPTGGEVNLLIMDNDGVTRREAMIDPRQGFSMLITDTIDKKVGFKWDSSSYGFFGVDGRGRLLFALDHFSKFEFYVGQVIIGVSMLNHDFIFNNLAGLTSFASIKNECLVNGDYPSACGRLIAPPENVGWWKILFTREKAMLASGKIEPDFGLVKP
jgi:hypothetical protein